MTRIKNALDDYVSFDPEDPSGHFTATVRSPKGRRVTVIGTLGDPEPEITGDAMLTDNAAIAQNLWSAVSEYAQAIALKEDENGPTAIFPTWRCAIGTMTGVGQRAFGRSRRGGTCPEGTGEDPGIPPRRGQGADLHRRDHRRADRESHRRKH